jgi:hypothetical protein
MTWFLRVSVADSSRSRAALLPVVVDNFHSTPSSPGTRAALTEAAEPVPRSSLTDDGLAALLPTSALTHLLKVTTTSDRSPDNRRGQNLGPIVEATHASPIDLQLNRCLDMQPLLGRFLGE